MRTGCDLSLFETTFTEILKFGIIGNLLGTVESIKGNAPVAQFPPKIMADPPRFVAEDRVDF